MRYILLDRITTLEPPTHAAGVKCVSLSDDVLEDHFPGYPVMPGALVVESMAQLGGVLLETSMRAKGMDNLHAALVLIERAKFRHPVRPGDRMELKARVVSVSEDGGQIDGQVVVEGRTVAEMTLGFAFGRVMHPDQQHRRTEMLNLWLHGTSHPS